MSDYRGIKDPLLHGVTKTAEWTFIYIIVAAFNNAESQDQVSCGHTVINTMEGIRKEPVETALIAGVKNFFQNSKSHPKIGGCKGDMKQIPYSKHGTNGRPAFVHP
jgi:hypothetical protein